MRTNCPGTLALLCLLVSAPGVGAQVKANPLRSELTLGVSFHDVSGQLGHAPAVEVGYHPGWWRYRVVRLDTGAMLALDGAVYGFAGFFVPVLLTRGLIVAPSFGAGAFGAGGRADLGSVVEFRSGITITLSVAATHPVAVSFYHLSNAGLRRPNPGMEVAGLSYSVRW